MDIALLAPFGNHHAVVHREVPPRLRDQVLKQIAHRLLHFCRLFNLNVQQSLHAVEDHVVAFLTGFKSPGCGRHRLFLPFEQLPRRRTAHRITPLQFVNGLIQLEVTLRQGSLKVLNVKVGGAQLRGHIVCLPMHPS